MTERGKPAEITTKEELAELVDSGRKTVVRFTADWCVPCKRFAPHFNQASDKLFGFNWAVVDVDKAPDLAEQFGVRGIPYVVAIEGDTVTPVAGRTVIQLVNEL